MEQDNEQINRIKEMESCFDQCLHAAEDLESAMDAFQNALPALKKLSEYYASPLWQQDYADDEEGRIPHELKRGVLSQDGVYDLLSDTLRLCSQMKALKKDTEKAARSIIRQP